MTTKPTIAEGLSAIRARWPDLVGPSEESPVFVLAAGWRSGSTFVQRAIMEECFLWGEPYERTRLIARLADTLRAFSDHWPHPNFFHQGQSTEELSKKFIANLYPNPEAILDAHLVFFDRLFAKPARDKGTQRWGLKEVKLNADHATYLKWLYPSAKIVFLHRNPYDCWRSYAARRDAGWQWYYQWPDQPITPRVFARHWKSQTESFLAKHQELNALLVRYEDLAAGNFESIEKYLGFHLSQEAAQTRTNEGPPPNPTIAATDYVALKEELHETASKLNYPPPEPDFPASKSSTPTIVSQKSVAPTTIIFVPRLSRIEPACRETLRDLQEQGYRVKQVYAESIGTDLLSRLATEAYLDNIDETIWLSPNLVFNTNDVNRLRSHRHPIVTGVYPTPSPNILSCDLPPNVTKLNLGTGGGLQRVERTAAGFLLVRRKVFEQIKNQMQLQLIKDPTTNHPIIPFFSPITANINGEPCYLTAGRALTERATRCQIPIWADTTIPITRQKLQEYGWKDLGNIQ